MLKGRFPFGTGRPPAPQAGPPAEPAGEAPAEPAGEALAEPRGEAGGPGARAGQWAPVVIDDPIFAFEPKPPSSASYRADTIADGWSTPCFAVRLASVRGYSHRYRATPRQDDAIAAFHEKSGCVLFAVADGVSSASESHLGATSACKAAIEAMRQQLGGGPGTVNLADVAESAAQKLTDQFARLRGEDAVTPAAVEDMLATTLVAGYVAPTPEGGAGEVVQIGDSSAWILEDGRYAPVLGQKNDPRAAVTSSAVSPLPRIPGRLAPVRFRLSPGAVLLVATDGFGDPLGDGDSKVGHLFAENLRETPPALGFAHLLDFSRDTFDDDRTLIAIWQRPHGPEAGP